MKTIWSFDLGKASIGEAVREKTIAAPPPHFPRAIHRTFR